MMMMMMMMTVCTQLFRVPCPLLPGLQAPGGKRVGIMFLVEAALGKEAGITQDTPSLTEAPPGHDSVVARGRQVRSGGGGEGGGGSHGASRRVVYGGYLVHTDASLWRVALA